MLIQISVDYQIGSIVQIKIANPDGFKMKGIVCGYTVQLGELVLYHLTYWDGSTGKHYGIELESADNNAELSD